MMERNFIFANMQAYDIARTIAYIEGLYHSSNEQFFPSSRLDEIISVLMDFKFIKKIDLEEMLPDPNNGVLMCMDMWLQEHGYVDHPVLFQDFDSIATYSVTDDEMTLEGEEYIESEDEEELCIATRILGDLNAETQDLDDLFIYGHDQDDPEARLDSFLE